jgi:hypothetical protein
MTRTLVAWLDEATTRCTRVADRYQWVHAHAPDTAAEVAIGRGDLGRAESLATTLAVLSARCDMR